MLDKSCDRDTRFYDESVKILDSTNEFVNQLPKVFKFLLSHVRHEEEFRIE